MNPLFNKIKSVFRHPNQSENMAHNDNNYIELMDTIRNLVGEAKPEKALDLLIKAGNQDAKLLKSRLLDLQEQEKYSKIKHKDASVIRNEIAHSILEIVSPSEAKTQSENPIEDLDELGEHTLVKKSEVLQFVSIGKTEQALLLLQKAGYTKATTWYEKYKAKTRLKNMGMLSYNDWYDFEKQINEDILTWAYLDEPMSQRILTAAEKLHIKELLNSNQIAEALHLCKGLGDKSAILLGFYTQIVKESKVGLLTHSEVKEYIKEFNNGIEELIA